MRTVYYIILCMTGCLWSLSHRFPLSRFLFFPVLFSSVCNARYYIYIYTHTHVKFCTLWKWKRKRETTPEFVCWQSRIPSKSHGKLNQPALRNPSSCSVNWKRRELNADEAFWYNTRSYSALFIMSRNHISELLCKPKSHYIMPLLYFFWFILYYNTSTA